MEILQPLTTAATITSHTGHPVVADTKAELFANSGNKERIGPLVPMQSENV